MSIQEVKVPQLSESVAEATLLEWKKKPGDAVKADEILIEIETDKVVLEVPAPASGVLTEILRTDGSTVVSGELIARVDTEAKAVSMPAALRCPRRRPCQRLPCQRLPSSWRRPASALHLAPAEMVASPRVMSLRPPQRHWCLQRQQPRCGLHQLQPAHQ